MLVERWRAAVAARESFRKSRRFPSTRMTVLRKAREHPTDARALAKLGECDLIIDAWHDEWNKLQSAVYDAAEAIRARLFGLVDAIDRRCAYEVLSDSEWRAWRENSGVVCSDG